MLEDGIRLKINLLTLRKKSTICHFSNNDLLTINYTFVSSIWSLAFDLVIRTEDGTALKQSKEDKVKKINK